MTFRPSFLFIDPAKKLLTVMDLGVNHSSDQHAWFRRAVEDRTAPEHDYYVWRDPGPNGDAQHEAEGVGDQVPLAALDPLSGIISDHFAG